MKCCCNKLVLIDDGYRYGVNMLIMNLKLIKYIQALDFIPGLAMPIAV